MQKYSNNYQDQYGNAIPDALVTVVIALSGLPATIYADDGVTVLTSLHTDARGIFEFRAADGKYLVTLTSDSAPVFTFPVTLADSAKLGYIVSPSDYNATGDGVTSDTAAFALLETSNKGKIVDLGGRTYAVSTVPRKNSYVNGVFKDASGTRQAASFKSADRTPTKYRVFGGQLAALHASLCNPMEQLTGITIAGDSITWGSNLPENATSSPRNHTVADPRDNFASASYVNELKRWIGTTYFDGAAPVLSNWVDSPSGQSTATYTRTDRLYTALAPFSAPVIVNSASASETATPGTALGYRHRLGVADNTATAEISFTFTGTTLTTVTTSIISSSADYVLTVDGNVIGTFATDLGTNTNQNERVHTFAYVKNKIVKIKAVYPASGSGVRYLDLEAIRIDKVCSIVNQGIIGTDAREYNTYNFGAFGSTIMSPGVNYVLVQLGTNDRSNTFPNYNQPNGVNNFARNLTTLISSITTPAGAAVILMTANPAASDDPAVYSFSMQRVRNTILDVASSLNLDVIDNYAALQNISTEAVTGDGLHPNLLGHSIMAQNIINAIESAGRSAGSAGSLTITSGKTPQIKNSITFQGTDSTTVTFPTTNATIARTDAAQTFAGDQIFSGLLGFGTVSTGVSVHVNKNKTGATTVFGTRSRGSIQSDVTSAAYEFSTFAGTAAASFTLPLLIHYGAGQNTFGAGSTVTDQRGFYVDGSLIGAGSNYGFYGNIAAGTGRWNLNMAGSAQNFLLGVTGIGVTAQATAALAVAPSTTAVASFNIGHGTAPTSPQNGDMWTTSAGLFIRINGVTKTVTLT